MQVAFTVGAEVEASTNHGGAARAGKWQWFAHLEVQNEPDGEQRPRQQHAKKQPEPAIHSAAPRVAVDVAKRHQPDGKNRGAKSDDSAQSERREYRMTSHLRRKRFSVDAGEIDQRSD